MIKSFSFGKIDANNCGRKVNEVVLVVALDNADTNKPRFSVCGEIYNSRGTYLISGGQCLDELNTYETIRSNPLFQKIYKWWKTYHLNDLHAGTIEQEAAIQELENSGYTYSYDTACDYLKSINLYEVIVDGKPYKYGHGWLYREIPENDLKEIKELLS